MCVNYINLEFFNFEFEAAVLDECNASHGCEAAFFYCTLEVQS